ncbi:TPA: hypothetical protein ACGO0H_002286, partial [Streptococcus suis]
MYEKIKLVRSEIVPKVKRIIGNYEKQLFLFKYVVTFISIGIAFITSKSIEQVVVSTIELLSIIILSNIIGKRNRLYAYIFNSVTVLIILLEQFFMYFGGTYLSMIMLSNVGSLQALSNKLPLYIICIIIVISISLLPIIVYDVERDTQLLMFLLLFVGEITYFNL